MIPLEQLFGWLLWTACMLVFLAVLIHAAKHALGHHQGRAPLGWSAFRRIQMSRVIHRARHSSYPVGFVPCVACDRVIGMNSDGTMARHYCGPIPVGTRPGLEGAAGIRRAPEPEGLAALGILTAPQILAGLDADIRTAITAAVTAEKEAS